jgi:hypothetical protein
VSNPSMKLVCLHDSGTPSSMALVLVGHSAPSSYKTTWVVSRLWTLDDQIIAAQTPHTALFSLINLLSL